MPNMTHHHGQTLVSLSQINVTDKFCNKFTIKPFKCQFNSKRRGEVPLWELDYPFSNISLPPSYLRLPSNKSEQVAKINWRDMIGNQIFIHILQIFVHILHFVLSFWKNFVQLALLRFYQIYVCEGHVQPKSYSFKSFFLEHLSAWWKIYNFNKQLTLTKLT